MQRQKAVDFQQANLHGATAAFLPPPIFQGYDGMLAAAAAQSTTKTPSSRPADVGSRVRGLETIVERVQNEFPAMSKETILNKIEIVRRNNGGTIAKLTFAKLIEQIRNFNYKGLEF